MRRKKSVELPYSRLKEELARDLVKEGYLSGVKRFKEKGKVGKMLHLDLKYDNDEQLPLKIKRVSKPGRRVYIRSKNIPPRFHGFLVLSTSRGLMTDREAKKRRLGGEILCEVS